MRIRLPITPQVLVNLKRVWQKANDKEGARLLWVASCLCFFGWGKLLCHQRPSMINTHLCYEDIRVDRHVVPSYVQVRLKASKTDPSRQGVDLYLGVTGKELCLVAAVLDFMAAREMPRARYSPGRTAVT